MMESSLTEIAMDSEKSLACIRRRQSSECKITRLISIIIFVTIFILKILAFQYISTNPNSKQPQLRLEFSGLFLIIFSPLLSGVVLSCDMKKNYQRSRFSLRIRGYIDSLSIISGVAGLGLCMISAVLSREVPRNFQLWELINCDYVDPKPILPPNYMMFTILSPLALQISIQCPHRIAVFISWLSSFLCILTAVSLSERPAMSCLFPLYSIFIGVIVHKLEQNDDEILRLSAEKINDSESKHNIDDQNFILKQIIENVSHDLLTPIQALEMGLETLESMVDETVTKTRSDTEETSQLLKSMSGTLSLQSMVIHRCIDVFASSDGSRLKPHFEQFDFAESVRKMSRLIKNMQSRIGIDVFLMKDMAKTIYSDKRWFEDNLLCVLSNAVKFSQDIAGVNVSVRIFARKYSTSIGDAADMLTVEITDSGTDIPEEQRKHLFMRPQRGSSRTQLGGAGLGLYSLSKRIEALEGFVGSHSRSDGICSGSVIWFSLPMSQSGQQSAKGQRDTHSPPGAIIRSYEESSWSPIPPRSMFDVISRNVSVGASVPDGDGDKSIGRDNGYDDFADEEAKIRVVKRKGKKVPDSKIKGVKERTPTLVVSQFDESMEFVGKRHTNESPDTSAVAAVATTKAQESIKRKLDVLAVDDSIAIMKIMKMNLKRAGHTVDEACNGAIALEKMKAKVYDVVLMDLQMPVMDGCEAVVSLRRFEKSPSSTGSARGRRQLVIGMSANIDLHTRQQALLCGMDDFLPKPFALDTMMVVVNEKLAVPSANASEEPAADCIVDFERDMYGVYSVVEEVGGTSPVPADNNNNKVRIREYAAISASAISADLLDLDEARDDVDITTLQQGRQPPLLAAAMTAHSKPSVLDVRLDRSSSIVVKSSIANSSIGDSSIGDLSVVSLSVLTVDDALSMLKVLRFNLTKAGHQVEQAENGAAALEMMKRKSYDVVLMDIEMPVMGGCEAARQMREYESSLASPGQYFGGSGGSSGGGGGGASQRVRQLIVGMSANTDEHTCRMALASGMDAFEPKPVRVDELTRIVRDMQT